MKIPLSTSRLLLALFVTVVPAACGDTGGPSGMDDPPGAPDLSRIEVVPPVPDGVAGIVGSEGAVEGSVQVRIVNTDATIRNGGDVVEVQVAALANGSFRASLPAQFGDELSLTALDAGKESQPAITSSGPAPSEYTGEGIGDVQIFPINNRGAVTLPFETGAERYVVITQSVNPSGQLFEVKVTGALGASVEERELTGALASRKPPPAEARIRELERRMLPLLASTGPARPRALAAAQDLGDEREFFALNRIDGFDPNNQNHFDEVAATLRYLGENTEVWVDDLTPAANLPASVIQTIGDTFDDQIHPTNRAAFGEESDVDDNDRVIILLTPTVNGLNTEEMVEDGVVVIGFFFGPNLIPRSQFPFSNEAEIFYAIIADPDMEFSPADFGLDGIDDLLSGVFAHEFEHMISANQHILVRNGPAEQIWLDEGLAHFAETLNGFHLQNRFLSAVFLDDPENWSLTGGEDTLERRGAAWLFVHYLVERFGEEILGQLVQTRLTGINNVETASDVSMMFLFYQWASALFLDGMSEDPLFHFPSRDLRAEFLLAKQQLTREIGDYLGIVERALVGPESAVTLTRELNGLASAYFEIGSSSAGAKPIVLRAGPGASLQVAVFRIE